MLHVNCDEFNLPYSGKKRIEQHNFSWNVRQSGLTRLPSGVHGPYVISARANIKFAYIPGRGLTTSWYRARLRDGILKRYIPYRTEQTTILYFIFDYG